MDTEYTDPITNEHCFKEGTWRTIVSNGTGLGTMDRGRGHRFEGQALAMQEELMAYVNSDVGSRATPWQHDYVLRTGHRNEGTGHQHR